MRNLSKLIKFKCKTQDYNFEMSYGNNKTSNNTVLNKSKL